MNLDIVILAAGKGTRMRSTKPKVMHHFLGKPFLEKVIETARTLHPKKNNPNNWLSSRRNPKLFQITRFTFCNSRAAIGYRACCYSGDTKAR